MPITDLRVGPRARALNEHAEGVRLKAYRDSGGVWTVGEGITGPDIGPHTVWNIAQERARFEAVLTDRANQLAALLQGAPTTRCQFGAMWDALFNAGAGNFAKSAIRTMHMDGDHIAAANAFIGWHIHDHAGHLEPGLVTRRAAERSLYLGEPQHA